MAHAFNPETGRQRQKDLCTFKVLVLHGSSRTARIRDPVLEKPKTNQKSHVALAELEFLALIQSLLKIPI